MLLECSLCIYLYSSDHVSEKPRHSKVPDIAVEVKPVDNSAYVCLLQYSPGEEQLHAFRNNGSLSLIISSERRPWLRVPEEYIMTNDQNEEVPRALLEDNGWISVSGVLSCNDSTYAPSRHDMKDRWRVRRRYEIWGPHLIDFVSDLGIVELKPGKYDLDFPEGIKASMYEPKYIDSLGKLVDQTNKGKNAFRYPHLRFERQWASEVMGYEPTDERMLESIAKSQSTAGMHLFFFRNSEHGPRPLIAMRPCREGVEDFFALYKDDVQFDTGTSTLYVPGEQKGFWIGKKGQLIRDLAGFYGVERIDVRAKQ